MDTKELEMRKIDELIEIKKELQNIRVILQSQYIPKYRRERMKDENGRAIRILHTLEDPLGDLRKEYNID